MNMSAFERATLTAGTPDDEEFQSLLASQQTLLQPETGTKPMDSISNLLNQFPLHQESGSLEQTTAMRGMQLGGLTDPNLSLNMISNSLHSNMAGIKNGRFSGAPYDIPNMRTQRRRSTLQFLNYVFDPIQHGQPQKMDNGSGQNDLEPLDFRPGDFDYKSRLTLLKGAMEKAQKSQQDIHDWDKRMGLKKSHSKTMRLTRRSRKKILKVLSKELNAIKRAAK